MTMSDPNAPSPGLRVLIVEDHADSATAISRLLRSIGHHPHVAGDLGTARSLADAHTFDLLICDITLPDGSGLDLMRQLTRKSGLKGIAVSGHASTADEASSRAAGFSAHLAKPVDFARLRQVIDQVAAS